MSKLGLAFLLPQPKEEILMYKLCFWLMIIGYLGLTLQGIDLRTKMIGFILLIANVLIFWR